MSSIIERLARKAAEACARAAWAQWRELAATAESGPRHAVVLDPEALLMGSLVAAPYERRLEDRMRWWTNVGLGITGVQRFRSLIRDASRRLQADAATFAASAAKVDRSWRAAAGEAAAAPLPTGRRPKGPTELALVGPAALLLKLRAAFGVSAKADVLAFLMAGAKEFGARQGVSVDETARALAYSAVSVRRALQEMVLSGLVTVAPTRPARFATNVSAWAALLGLGGADVGKARATMRAAAMPRWRDWAAVYGYFDAVVALGDDAALKSAAPVVQASRLRDLHERFAAELERSGFPSPDPRPHPGERFVAAFEAHLERMADGVAVDAGAA